MEITKKEYKAAKEITDAYESEQKRLNQIKIDAFESELKDYFKNNLIDGFFELKEFKLEGHNIIPENPYMEENYDGGNDKDIETLCKKHDVKFSIIYWCYHK